MEKILVNHNYFFLEESIAKIQLLKTKYVFNIAIITYKIFMI